MDKKIIRVIIYEGPEEIIDRYEIRNLKGSIIGGVPNLHNIPNSKVEQRNFITNLMQLNIPTHIKITAETVSSKLASDSLDNAEAEVDILLYNIINVLEQHDSYNPNSPTKHGA